MTPERQDRLNEILTFLPGSPSLPERVGKLLDEIDSAKKELVIWEAWTSAVKCCVRRVLPDVCLDTASNFEEVFTKLVRERDEAGAALGVMRTHANEGWNLCNKRTAERTAALTLLYQLMEGHSDVEGIVARAKALYGEDL